MLNYKPKTEPLRVIIGAGEQAYDGWTSTNKEDLDLLRPEDWQRSFENRLVYKVKGDCTPRTLRDRVYFLQARYH